MTNPDDLEFERIMNKEFTRSERREFGLSAFMTELLEPKLNIIVEIFSGMHVRKALSNHEDLIKELTEDVQKFLEPSVPLVRGDEILLTKVNSYISGDLLGIIPEGFKIIGSWQGLIADNWYELPLSDTPFTGNPLDFIREVGLIAAVDGAVLIADDSEQRIGDVLVPLEHGEPRWEKVFRPF